jgi:hypothetical protein
MAGYGLTELTCINGNDARSEQDDIASLVRKASWTSTPSERRSSFSISTES